MIRRFFAPLFILVFLAISVPFAVNAAPQPATLNVAVDQSTTLPLSAPASSVFIANPEVADVQVMSPTTVMVFGKRTGQTTLVVGDANGRTLAQRTIVVTQDLTDLRAALNAVIPNHKIKVESVPNGIVLMGETRDAGTIEDARRLAMRYVPANGEIINRIKVKGSNQIQIRVRFAEVSRDVDKRFGIDWESLGNIGGFAFGLASGSTVISQGANLLNRVRPTTGDSTHDIFSFSHQGKRFDINGMIDALAEDGLVTVLAEPSLTAMSGETASFLAGGEFPIPVPQSQNTITIMFRQYGISLAFTPTLVGEDRINLHVKPEVSQLTTAGAITINSISVPALTTRRAETTIELGSGQSFAIAGLLNSNQQQSIDKYPFLGDLPILGELFRSSRFQNNQSELVIIITPYIVRPANEQLSLPTDGYSPATDVERILKNRSSSGDPDMRPITGEATAVRVAPPQAEEPAVPEAAPVAPVSAVPASEAPKTVVPVEAPAPAAMTEPAPVPQAALPAPPKTPAQSPTTTQKPRSKAKADDLRKGLAGPGGFTLE